MRSLCGVPRFLLLWIFFALCLLSQNSLTAQIPVANLHLLDSLAARASHHIIQEIRQTGHDTVRLDLSAHAAEQLFRQHLFTDPPFTFYRNDSTAPGGISLLSVIITDCGVRYFLYEPDNDSLVREAQVIVSASYSELKGPVRTLPGFSAQYRDTISRTYLPFIESRQYSFANAPVPEAPAGFFTEVGEPIIVVSAAIITLVLLFTVRSQ